MQTQLFPCAHATPLLPAPIVLLNGWGVSHDAWGELIPSLQDFTSVIVVDIIYEADIDVVCEKIVAKLPEKNILLGWSLGGMLATRVAAQYPQKVIGLMTLATNMQFVASDRWPEAMDQDTFDIFYQSYQENKSLTLKRFLALIAQGDECVREQKRYIKSLDCATNSFPSNDGLEGLKLLAMFSNHEYLAKITCPTLHIYGENDQLVPLATVKKQQALAAHHHYQTLPMAGHVLHYPSHRLLPMMTVFFKVFI